MTYSIRPDFLVDCFRDTFNSRYPDFQVADNLAGGGGYENWTLVNFLLYLKYRYGDFDYQREFTVDGSEGRQTRVDLVFNWHMITPTTPFILTEWKCNPVYSAMATGCSADVGKLARIISDYSHNPPGRVYPLPLVFAVGPDGEPPFAGFGKYGFGGGTSFYLSGAATWEAVGVYAYTWYAHNVRPEPTASNRDAVDRSKAEGAPENTAHPLP
ncbi:hypothetical protein IOD16_28060 [Saccharothrix sp. 6-C]|uniref:hypothetical protein n=1 Tax=Saccharothrix sp. 6-C TaxID=2781735 RepID=UPI00191778A2|nr:hypothetical protein [Saccharothrix sp. 6-C]QQQ74950.1 hypothetical protein IOD16_28060 [Saccharothrix sp. 6-C]